MDATTKLELEAAARVLSAAGVLFYEPAHPVSFGPQVQVFEREKARLRLWATPGSAGPWLHVELDGAEIGRSDPLQAAARSALDDELRTFFGSLTPPLWPLPVAAPKFKSAASRPKKATGTLAARRAAVTPRPARIAAPTPTNPMADGFVPFARLAKSGKKSKPTPDLSA